MARIRSIKPDFFTSEKIASLPLSTRLLFIGLWTHVDDNGVTIDNERLINAAIWPLEDDPLEALQRTREDLRRLSTASLIVRYEAAGKALLFITGWDEHQKVSHPAKPRYPRPAPEQIQPPPPSVNSRKTDSAESLQASSGDSPETLPKPLEIFAPEQGAGSREQGKEVPPSAGAAAPDAGEPVTAQTIVGEWIERCAQRPPQRVIGQLSKEIKALLDEGIHPDHVRAGVAEWMTRNAHPSTLASFVNGAMNARAAKQGTAPTSNGSGSQLPPRGSYDVNKVFKNRRKSA